MIGADNIATRVFTPARSLTISPDTVDPEGSTAASARALLSDPVTYAVAGGAVLAAIGGWMLLRGKRHRK